MKLDMNMIILAAPGAGKGTQAEILSKHYNIPTISTGAILRDNIQNGTKLGEIAKNYINDGKLVPDDVIIDIVLQRLKEKDCENGFILDGFPRTLEQAKQLDKSGIVIDTALALDVKDSVIIERVGGRLECKKCKATYHKLYKVPEVEGVCDKCGGELGTRADDKPETVKSRLETYHKMTEPLIGYYREKGVLKVAVGKDSIEDTTAEVLNALK